MNTMLLHLWVVYPMAAKDFVRDPDWDGIAFAGPIVQWLIGILLALVVVAAFVKGAILLLGMPGSDRHKARSIGEGLLFCAVAIFAAFTFSDIFLTMIGSIQKTA